jgi:hypothetical protein
LHRTRKIRFSLIENVPEQQSGYTKRLVRLELQANSL